MTRTHPNQSLDTLIFLIILDSITVYGLSLYLSSSESRKTIEQKFIFQIGTLNPHGITSVFHSTTLFLFSRHHIPIKGVAPLSAYKPTQPTIPPIALTKG